MISNFEIYKFNKPNVNRQHFTTYNYYKNKQYVGSSKSAKDPLYVDCVVEKVFDQEGFEHADKTQRQERFDLHKQFKHDMCQDLGISHHVKRDKIVALAFEFAENNYDYEHIYDIAYELVDLLK